MLITRTSPLTVENWPDLEDLFGERGACGGCWCMYWRLTRADYASGDANRQAFHALVKDGEPTGLLAYAEDGENGGEHAIGWCAVSPRSAFARLKTARVGRGGTDEPGRWSVPCFYVRAGHRRRGGADTLLAAACDYARDHGAEVIEGYPTTSPKAAASDLYVGTRGLFERNGFTVASRPTASRLVMERRCG
ncbi:GNAT family N-acetyltransferase [Streptomyces sp. NPDC004327]|uniref:GNAT family N-acetyltransferase n=1 Tax=Streptomyces sp. NPDC004327 TaxID=3364699 RepID=UPI0036A61D67